MAGVVGADMPGSVVLVLGSANLVADGFAMGAGNFSATKAEVEDYRRRWRSNASTSRWNRMASARR